MAHLKNNNEPRAFNIRTNKDTIMAQLSHIPIYFPNIDEPTTVSLKSIFILTWQAQVIHSKPELAPQGLSTPSILGHRGLLGNDVIWEAQPYKNGIRKLDTKQELQFCKQNC